MVSGHVDGVAEIVARRDFNGMAHFTILAPADLAKFIAVKGSVALDGTSLTVNAVDGDRFEVLLIPHTLAVTTWGERKAGDRINIEVDQMARYAARLIEARGQGTTAQSTATITSEAFTIGVSGLADFQFEIVDSLVGDRGGQNDAVDVDLDVSGRLAFGDRLHDALDLVSRAQFHRTAPLATYLGSRDVSERGAAVMRSFGLTEIAISD